MLFNSTPSPAVSSNCFVYCTLFAHLYRRLLLFFRFIKLDFSQLLPLLVCSHICLFVCRGWWVAVWPDWALFDRPWLQHVLPTKVVQIFANQLGFLINISLKALTAVVTFGQLLEKKIGLLYILSSGHTDGLVETREKEGKRDRERIFIYLD